MTGKPKFDGTINLGHVLTIVAMLIGGATAYSSIQVSITELKKDVQHFGSRMAQTESDIKSLRDRVRDLELRSRN